MQRAIFSVNERGLRIGQDHPRAKLSDAQVDEIRDLRERDHAPWSISALARRFGVTRNTIWRIVTYRTRAQTPAGYRRPGGKVFV